MENFHQFRLRPRNRTLARTGKEKAGDAIETKPGMKKRKKESGHEGMKVSREAPRGRKKNLAATKHQLNESQLGYNKKATAEEHSAYC